jgi:hypothetical protein
MKIHTFKIGKIAFICSFILLIFASTQAFCTTYYVCKSSTDCNAGNGSGWSTGNDRNSGTKKSAPFASIEQASDIVKAGDTVIVGDGTYTDKDNNDSVVKITRGGTSGNVITFRSENNGGAIISGDNWTTGFGFSVNAPYIKIQGFQIIETIHNGVRVFEKAHHVIITQNELHRIGWVKDTSSDGHSAFYSSPYAYNITIDRNIFHDIGRYDIGCVHCYRHDQGVYAKGRFITITNNLFYNFWAGWAVVVRGHRGDAGSKPTHIIANNTFAYNKRPDSRAKGHIRFYTSDSNKKMRNVIIHNNIFYSEPGDSAISMSSDTQAVGTDIRNNVTDSRYICSEDLGSAVTNYINADYKKVNVRSLPKAEFYMTDPKRYNFKLQSDAVYLIDKGRSSYAPNNDFLGVKRPKAEGYDIGAYEYIAYGYDDDSDPPSPPEGLRVLN